MNTFKTVKSFHTHEAFFVAVICPLEIHEYFFESMNTFLDSEPIFAPTNLFHNCNFP
jgi:hypothetical protein